MFPEQPFVPLFGIDVIQSYSCPRERMFRAEHHVIMHPYAAWIILYGPLRSLDYVMDDMVRLSVGRLDFLIKKLADETELVVDSLP